jgi:aminoglycoside phosphotransferase family enzyme/predicted kinase
LKRVVALQKDVVSFLSNPAAHGGVCSEVRVIQTHISWVFLTGKYAYKIKKPVDFGFLDYTTLEKRGFYCSEEIRLNKRLAPEVYIDVVPITRGASGLALGGEGGVVEYAVRMNELPQASMMREMLGRREVRYSHMEDLARTVASFHDQAETGEGISVHGAVETVRFNWIENFDQTRAARGGVFPDGESGTLKRTIGRFLDEKAGLIAARVEEQRVRQCHGDLHSGNIFITDKPHIFDCIEFNPRFSCCDTVSEVAFLVMDLDFLGFRALGQHFLEKYMEHSGDGGLLELLDFYRSYRAYVRAKVTSFKLADPGIGQDEKAAAAKTAREYFDLSCLYSRSLFRKPFIVMVMGLPGVGKTTVAERLSEGLNAFHYNSDVVRKQLAGIQPESHEYGEFGAGLYSPQMSWRTYGELGRRAVHAAGRGVSSVLDATFNRAGSRKEIESAARDACVRVFTILAAAPEDVILERIEKRQKGPSASDATAETYRKIKAVFDPVECDFTVDTSLPLDPQMDAIIGKM